MAISYEYRSLLLINYICAPVFSRKHVKRLYIQIEALKGEFASLILHRIVSC